MLFTFQRKKSRERVLICMSRESDDSVSPKNALNQLWETLEESFPAEVALVIGCCCAFKLLREDGNRDYFRTDGVL